MKDHEQWGDKNLVDKIKMTILVSRRERVLSVMLQKETFTILLLYNECIEESLSVCYKIVEGNCLESLCLPEYEAC